MKKTGAWLARYAMEQIGVKYTFGIPGVHNTELYDELNKSPSIEPVLVTHEGGGAFMADALSRTSDSIGTLLIVPAAGATHAASGIGEAFLDGIPMLVISGGVRSNSDYGYQLHEMDQQSMLAPITKKTYKIQQHADIIPSIYEAYEIATQGEPGPVFIEIPVNLQIDAGEVEQIQPYQPKRKKGRLDLAKIKEAARQLAAASHPGLFLGWGAIRASEQTTAIADLLDAPVATTLQGLSAFPAMHPLHTGMSFGPAAVPAASNAFADCDCMLAVGTRFGEIATGSFGVTVPPRLVHIDINPAVFDVNYPASVAIEGDAREVLTELLAELRKLQIRSKDGQALRRQIRQDKQSYLQEWFKHNSGQRVNPARFFASLRQQLPDDAYVLADDGNHTFLTAELMPIHKAGHFLSPTDFNCMGYCVPAIIGTKLANPDKTVVGIIGDGAFMMTAMEMITASNRGMGAVFVVFNDGELSQISQAQQVPYNRKTCTVLGNKLKLEGVALATGAEFVGIKSNADIEEGVTRALALAGQGKPVLVDVNVDYSKATRFTKGIVGTNLKRLPGGTKVRMVSRALKRKVTG